MKSHYYLLLFSILILLCSCSKDTLDNNIKEGMIELTQDEIYSISYDDAQNLSDNDVIDIVKSFDMIHNEDVQTRSSSTSFNITKKSYINIKGEFDDKEIATRSNNGESYLTSEVYEVEFNNMGNKGKALVSIDGRVPSVIAFIPNYGNEKAMELSGANDLLHASKACYLYKTIKRKELVDSLKTPTLQKISKTLNIPINEITYERIEKYIILKGENQTRVAAVARQPKGIQRRQESISPMVKTNWGQEDPYNGWFYVPGWQDWVRTYASNGSKGKEYKSVPVGCVNVAIGQMMSYTHYYNPFLQFNIPGRSMKFNPQWNLMTKTPKIDDPGMSSTGYFHVQYLLADLYQMNKTSSDKDWDGAVVGSSVTEDNMLKTMNKYFRYDSKFPFNGDLAWQSLRSKNLILMLSKDHVFIISGMLVTTLSSKTRKLVQEADVYWHANFGWADQCTGYYQLDKKANVYFEAGSVKEWDYKMNFLNNVRKR